MNREKLIKLLMLSTSPVDGEALSAIRMANRMLLQENLSWEEFLNKKHEKESAHKNKERSSQDWHEQANGNWCRYSDIHQSICTVFRDKKFGGWKWVCSGKFSSARYTSFEAAMNEAPK